MNPARHSFQRLERRIWAVLTLRQSVWWASAWFLALGLVVLLVRMLTWWPTHFLVAAVGVVVPMTMIIGWWRWRQRPARTVIQALLDRENGAGGLLLAGEQVDISAWQGNTPRLSVPGFRWQSRRPMLVLASAAVFLGISILIPEKHLGLAARHSLEIGQLAGEISEEIKLLKEEEILEEDKANELQRELSRMEKESSGRDPAKTWEALDHLKQSSSDLARQAAEEALRKLDALKKSETLAGAVGLMPDPNEAVQSAAMQDLLAMLRQAKLEEGLLRAKLPEELKQALATAKDGKLTPAELRKLMEALKEGRLSLGECMASLANLKLIDAELLGKCKAAGQCPNPDALAKFLCNSGCTNGLAALVTAYCRGGVSRGRGDAPMTWQDPSDFTDTQSKDQTLPMGNLAGLKDAQLVGISRSAPEVTGDQAAVASGALSGAAAGGGSAQLHKVLPRHQAAVRQFFKREN